MSDHSQVPLSVIIPTKNEAQNLARCLGCVQWADEILVVDSQSSDDTVAIARPLATRVEVREWPGYSAGVEEISVRPRRRFSLTTN